MAVKCGWASIGETGKGRGNKPGDQTGREVRIGNWYDFGQSAVYRWKDRKLAQAYATAIEALCKNENVGYDMNDRDSLWNDLKAVDWKPTKVKKKCECDCSMLVGCGINCVTKEPTISKSIWTGNLDELLMKTGLFKKLTDKKYLTSDKYLKTGDIANAPNHHVISALGNGSASDSSAVAKPTLKKGSTGYEVRLLQKNLKQLGFKGEDKKPLEEDGDFGKNTDFAVREFQRKHKLEDDGIYGKLSAAKMSELI